jgi:SAM-dependent methyltransferase
VADVDFVGRTRASYDAFAAEYAARFDGGMPDKPLDRGLYAAFAELVRAGGGGPVADVGCGPGYGTAHLRALGLDAFGIDLSPEMVATARRAHPDLRFVEGSMLALDLPDGGLAGLTALYSIIHIPTGRLPEVFAEFHRVLAPGGYLLLAFQVGDGQGDELVHRTELLGHAVSLDYYRRSPELVAGLLAGAGLEPRAQLLREPDDDGVEKLRRAYLLARRPAAAS